MQSAEIAKTIYYWSEGTTSEADYLFSYQNKIIPMEAKAGPGRPRPEPESILSKI